MNLIKYFFAQFILVSLIIFIGNYWDFFINTPFTSTDLITVVIGIGVLIVLVPVYEKLKESSTPIRLLNKVLLTVLAIFIATFVIGLFKGEILFH